MEITVTKMHGLGNDFVLVDGLSSGISLSPEQIMRIADRRLGTSLPWGFTLAERVVELYALRMRIEEAFRDLKSTRFGLSLELHRAYHVESQGQEMALLGAPTMQRLQILLLIATLALIVAWLLGKAIELTGQHRHYQANTVRDRVVLQRYSSA